MPDCPTVQSRRFGSETPRRDETRRDESDARHGATRGMAHADARREFEEAARRREDLYDALIRELERVPDDAWDAGASFLTRFETRRRRLGPDWRRWRV